MMKTDKRSFKILIADDDEHIIYAFRQFFHKEKYVGIFAKDGDLAYRKTMEEKPDLVFLDFTMPKLNGLEVLQKIKKDCPDIPVVVITGYGTMHVAVQAIKEGAYDYFTKPLDLHLVRSVIAKVAGNHAKEAPSGIRNLSYNSEVVESFDIIGKSVLMQEVYKLIGSISVTPNSVPVLITGESGTGKELVARAIHTNSGSGHDPFIGINCNAIPEGLLESELFGYEKGSFTGAYEQKPGKFELAGNGTIFLDEVGDLSLNFQQKLLRVLQNRSYERLGGVKTKKVTARFITATNIDIHEAVRNQLFRKDLYYRLNVAHIHLPPLRDRREDIPLLVDYFIQKFNSELKKRITGVTLQTMKLFLDYQFPGNIRELANIIERAFILSKNVQLELELIEDTIDQAIPALKRGYHGKSFSEAKTQYLLFFEKEYIEVKLAENNGNVTNAAKKSGMTRQNFQRLLEKHHIKAGNYR